MFIIFRKDKIMFAANEIFKALPETLSSEACCSLKAWSEVPFMDNMPLLSLDTDFR